MATVSISIVDDDDDGFDNGSAWLNDIDNYSNSDGFQVKDAPSGVSQGGLRFLAVGIPQGATINTATLTLKSKTSLAGMSSLQAFGDDVDDAPAWTDISRPASGFTDTTGGTVNSSLPGADTVFTMEIAACVQDIVNRAGYTNTSDMRFRVFPIDTYNTGIIFDLDASHSDEAVLDVDFTAAASETIEADAGSYAYSGKENSLLLSSILGVDTDLYTYIGTDIDLIDPVASDTLIAEIGNYTYAGTNISFGYSSRVATGSYIVTGTDLDLSFGTSITADTSNYSINGTLVNLNFAGNMTVESDSYIITGTDIPLFDSANIWTDQGIIPAAWVGGTEQVATWTGKSPTTTTWTDI